MRKSLTLQLTRPITLPLTVRPTALLKGEAGIRIGNFQSYNDADTEYSGYVAMYGVDKIPPLTDFDASMLVFPSSFPDKTVISWRIGASEPERIQGWIHVDDANYDESPGTLPGGPRQIYTLTALKYDLGWTFAGDARSGALFDCWMTTTPHATGVLTDRVAAVGALAKVSSAAALYVASLPSIGTFTDSNGIQWAGVLGLTADDLPNNLFYRPGYLDFEGVFDLDLLLIWLATRGRLTGNEYWQGQGFGIEPYAGAGSFTIDQFERVALASAARVPFTIADLVATAQSSTTVLLAFTNAAGSTSHQYRVNGGTWTAMPGDKIVTGLTASTAYTFEVRGVNGTGNGAASNVANATTSAPSVSNILNSANWTGGGYSGMSIGGGFLNWFASPPYDGFGNLVSLSAHVGKYFELSYVVSGLGAGSAVQATIAGGTAVPGIVRSANGTFTERFLIKTGNNQLAMNSTTDPGPNTLKVATGATLTGPYTTATVGGA